MKTLSYVFGSDHYQTFVRGLSRFALRRYLDICFSGQAANSCRSVSVSTPGSSRRRICPFLTGLMSFSSKALTNSRLCQLPFCQFDVKSIRECDGLSGSSAYRHYLWIHCSAFSLGSLSKLRKRPASTTPLLRAQLLIDHESLLVNCVRA